ncbi:hypothetical protein [Burkholderia sp. S-53]|uniref:hypothetical protein n=1 Tax=Burkholderia sp. S-53 TaxID=2906514 RepID=UPI0021D25BCA|nr:hypothetical protein [Burkholderia sp. S-53]UXU85372.1 hypothetical protein LXM88_03145 [Burkholderia sp. S-53]
MHVADEGVPRIEFHVDEIEDIAALAEVRAFRANEKRPDVRFAGRVDGFAQVFGKRGGDQVERRVAEHDVADGIVTLESD